LLRERRKATLALGKRLAVSQYCKWAGKWSSQSDLGNQARHAVSGQPCKNKFALEGRWIFTARLRRHFRRPFRTDSPFITTRHFVSG
jgi:hypothetical protein